MKQAIENYWNARILLTKSLHKMNYRIKKIPLDGKEHLEFYYHKNMLYKELRKMDRQLRKITEKYLNKL